MVCEKMTERVRIRCPNTWSRHDGRPTDTQTDMYRRKIYLYIFVNIYPLEILVDKDDLINYQLLIIYQLLTRTLLINQLLIRPSCYQPTGLYLYIFVYIYTLEILVDKDDLINYQLLIIYQLLIRTLLINQLLIRPSCYQPTGSSVLTHTETIHFPG
jgi:hypothetical protein